MSTKSFYGMGQGSFYGSGMYGSGQSSTEVIEKELGPDSIISFNDGLKNKLLKECVVNIEPVQSGSGDPSPDNVRLITGWMGAKVTRCGKNLLPYLEQGAYLVANGNPVASVNTIRTPKYFLPAGTYTFSVSNASSVTMLTWLLDGTYETNKSKYTPKLTFDLSEGRIVGFNLYKSDGLTPADESMAQFELGSTPTDYEPYQGETYDITFPTEAGTVYGGVLDLTNGTLTVTHGYKELGALNIDSVGESSDGVKRLRVKLNPKQASTGDAYCDKHVVFRNYQHRRHGEMYLNNTNLLYYYDDRFTDAATAKQILETENPVLVYPLLDPVTYQLTPQQITTLLGENSVWADTGDITIKYLAKK